MDQDSKAGGSPLNDPAERLNPAEERRVTAVLNTEAIMQFFNYEHLPAHLREVSKHFTDVADWMLANLPRSAERSAGLRKLLEAKDCAVRAKLAK